MEWIALLIFAAFDYFGYNSIGRWNKIVYRVIQTLLQVGLTYWLWTARSSFEAVAFLFLWWSWIGDLFYYMLYDLLKIFGYAKGDFSMTFAGADDERAGWRTGEPKYSEDFGSMTAFEDQVLGNKVTWAWFTVLGLIKWAVTGVRKQVMTAFEIFMQLFVMLSIYGIARAFLR